MKEYRGYHNMITAPKLSPYNVVLYGDKKDISGWYTCKKFLVKTLKFKNLWNNNHTYVLY